MAPRRNEIGFPKFVDRSALFMQPSYFTCLEPEDKINMFYKLDIHAYIIDIASLVPDNHK